MNKEEQKLRPILMVVDDREKQGVKVVIDLDNCPKLEDGAYALEPILYELAQKDPDFAEILIKVTDAIISNLEKQIAQSNIVPNKRKDVC